MTLEARFTLRRPSFCLEVELLLSAAGVTAIVGASGSGKTSLLRCLAGIDRATPGYLRFGDAVWQDNASFVPAHQRPIGYVFQDARLFPHLSVRKNIEFGLRRVAPGQQRFQLAQVVELLGIEALLERRTPHLSGGERQRVAIARALLASPCLLLMDEPLASLDLESRHQILPYFERLDRELHLPILYVTHSPAEVARLARTLVVLDAGRVQAFGPLNEVLTRPDLALAHDPDAGAVLEAEVVEHAPAFHLSFVRVPGGRLAISERALPVGARTRVLVRARDVSVSLVRPERTSITNLLEMRVLDIHPDRDPAHRLLRLHNAEATVLARITLRAVIDLDLRPGVALFAQVKSVVLAE